MARMFLQSDNGGYGVLIGDGEKWYYWSEYNLPVELDADTNKENAEIIRNAINSGDMSLTEQALQAVRSDDLCLRLA